MSVSLRARSILGLSKQLCLSRFAASGRNAPAVVLTVVQSRRGFADTKATWQQHQTKDAPLLTEMRPQGKLTCFDDAMKFMNEVKDVMAETNPFFPLVKDTSYPVETRMSFVPYALGFALGFADFADNVLRVDKPESMLTPLEKKVNDYVAEDNFHYNFYLADLKALGPKMESFGTLDGVLRHTWCPEGAAGRRVVFALVETCASSDDTLLKMLSCELVEAGLVEYFTTIYAHVVKKEPSLPTLHYFGDTHVGLELGHTVTAQFSGKNPAEMEENRWMFEEMTPEVADACQKSIVNTMDCFDKMFRSFHRTVLAIHDGKMQIRPERFVVQGDPPTLPMANILGY